MPTRNPRRAAGRPHADLRQPALSDAYTALQNALKTMATDVRADLVFRCDELPQLEVPAAQLETIFSLLLQALIARKEALSRLYLHIRCGAAEKEAARLTGELSLYCIRFETNVRPCADWLKTHRSVLNEINHSLLPFAGALQVNESPTTGCLFTLSLPGKF